MATVVTFGNRNIIEPGVYSQIKANVSSNPTPFSTGNVLIIDTGEGAGFGGGSGISGDIANGIDSVYGFDNLSEFRQFVRGGLLWDLAEYLFIPVNGAQGVPKIFLVKAAITTAAKITYTFTAGANGGTFAVRCKNEGTAGNGVLGGVGDTKVRKGYAANLKTGVIDNAKYYIEFTEGTFKGLDSDNDPYDGQAALLCNPIVIARSPEFISINELIDWAKGDYSFNARFELDATTAVIGTGDLVVGDYTANNSIKLASGGTDDYSSIAYDSVLASIGEVDYTFVLSLKNASNAQGVENTKLLYHITQEAEFKKFMFVGGGNNELAFDQAGGSIEIAQYFDSAYAVVCHSGFKQNVQFSAQKKIKSSLYHAALVCGRLAGLQPQTSGTFKTLRAKEWNHQLTQSQREIALQAGVLHNRYVPNLGYVINQAINTLQKNTQLINPDGTSAEISVMRIAEQLNKELVLNMRPIFVGQNLNTASPADVKAWMEGYLTLKTATRTQDNLIIRFSNVSVIQKQDYYEISYNFVPNSPLNKLFITGFILDANLTA
jgi:hypothetical protein